MGRLFVGMTGLEPAAPSSQARCATNCATSRFYNNNKYNHFIVKNKGKIDIINTFSYTTYKTNYNPNTFFRCF